MVLALIVTGCSSLSETEALIEITYSLYVHAYRATDLVATMAATPECLPVAQSADADWKAKGIWALDTANPNCWKSALDGIVCKSAADVLWLQESRLDSTAKVASAEIEARDQGWNPTFSLAHSTDIIWLRVEMES